MHNDSCHLGWVTAVGSTSQCLQASPPCTPPSSLTSIPGGRVGRPLRHWGRLAWRGYFASQESPVTHGVLPKRFPVPWFLSSSLRSLEADATPWSSPPPHLCLGPLTWRPCSSAKLKVQLLQSEVSRTSGIYVSWEHVGNVASGPLISTVRTSQPPVPFSHVSLLTRPAEVVVWWPEGQVLLASGFYLACTIWNNVN